MTTPNKLKQELAEKYANKTQDDLGDHNSLTQEHRILVANNLAILTEFEQRLKQESQVDVSAWPKLTDVMNNQQQKGGDEKCATMSTAHAETVTKPEASQSPTASPAPKSTEESRGALQCSVCALFFTDVELQPEGTFICDGCANRL